MNLRYKDDSCPDRCDKITVTQVIVYKLIRQMCARSSNVHFLFCDSRSAGGES